MKTTKAASYPVRIYMAGNLAQAEQVCREFCWDGACVTVTPTNYIYKGGEESGVVVGFINYPRFPKTPEEMLAKAEDLAHMLMSRLCQSSYTIETPDETTWYSRREVEPQPQGQGWGSPGPGRNGGPGGGEEKKCPT